MQIKFDYSFFCKMLGIIGKVFRVDVGQPIEALSVLGSELN